MTSHPDELPNGKRPIVELIDMLGKKWMMRIIWEMSKGPCTFRELQSRCGNISPTSVNLRLKELVKKNLVAKSKPNGYCLSPLGEELMELFEPLNTWVKKWSYSLMQSNQTDS